jgi:hypothetical protein
MKKLKNKSMGYYDCNTFRRNGAEKALVNIHEIAKVEEICIFLFLL